MQCLITTNEFTYRTLVSALITSAEEVMNLALIILFDGGYTKKSSSDFHEPCEIMDYNHGKTQ